MPAILDDIGSFITSAGLVDTGWELKKQWTPDTPDQVIVVAETGGYEPPDTSGVNNASLSIQVRVRAGALDYPTARTKWDELFADLHGARFTGASSGKLYVYLMALNDAPLSWYDSNQRPNLTLNMKVLMVR